MRTPGIASLRARAAEWSALMPDGALPEPAARHAMFLQGRGEGEDLRDRREDLKPAEELRRPQL